MTEGQPTTPHKVLRNIGIHLPIFQAPIGSIAAPELAAAVSNAGAVGHLACTWRTPEQLDELFCRMRTLSDKPCGANFMLVFPIEEGLAVALEHRVSIISFFWGNAGRYVDRVKAAGAVAIQVVGSIGEAMQAAEAGFDKIVAQGREAGGHVCGRLGLIALLPQVVDAVAPLPVLAAGAIADRRGGAAALALGVVGGWVGTRFLAAEKANIHPVYRDRVLACSGDDTLYSELFDVGWPGAPLRSLGTARPICGSRPGGQGRPSGREKERLSLDVGTDRRFRAITSDRQRKMLRGTSKLWRCMPERRLALSTRPCLLPRLLMTWQQALVRETPASNCHAEKALWTSKEPEARSRGDRRGPSEAQDCTRLTYRNRSR